MYSLSLMRNNLDITVFFILYKPIRNCYHQLQMPVTWSQMLPLELLELLKKSLILGDTPTRGTTRYHICNLKQKNQFLWSNKFGPVYSKWLVSMATTQNLGCQKINTNLAISFLSCNIETHVTYQITALPEKL